MTVVKTSNHHLYDVDVSIYSNGNEKDNMILHYHQNPSANIIKNKSTNIFYATNLHFFYHTDGHGFSFHTEGRGESRILFLHTESHGWPRRSCQNCSLFRNLRDIPRCSVWMSWLDGHGVVFYFTRMVTGSHRVFSVTTDLYFHETCPVQKWTCPWPSVWQRKEPYDKKIDVSLMFFINFLWRIRKKL